MKPSTKAVTRLEICSLGVVTLVSFLDKKCSACLGILHADTEHCK